jgi:hypothetical protein
VSVVDRKADKVVRQLLYWPVYADDKLQTPPANNTKFGVTIPKDLGAACANSGDCLSRSSLKTC